MQIPDEQLRGRTVIGADGRAIGEVAGITIDAEGLKLDTLQVKLRRSIEDELGVPHRRFASATLDIPFAKVQSIGDAVVLSVSIDSLRVPAGPVEHATT